MSKYAKWIGGALGWAFGGPLGALLGYTFGSMLGGFQVTGENDSSQQTRPGDFAGALLVLSAAVIRADGKIRQSELDYVQKFFVRQFGERHGAHYAGALNLILQQNFSTREICEQIRQHMDYSSRAQLLHYLFGIAKADDHVDRSEIKVVFEIATDLGIDSRDFESVQAMFYKDSSSAYSVLEIDPSATDAEVKKAFRTMATRFHPDKLAHLGQEHQKAAHEKFQSVNSAYEQIKKERGFV